MLRYIFVLLSMFMCNSSRQQIESCDEIKIKGFFIRKFKESEIRDYFINKDLEKAGKSHFIAIDRYQEKFFIPLDSVESLKELDSLLSRNVNFYETRPFVLPSTLATVAIRKFCNQEMVPDSSLNDFQLDNFYSTMSLNSRDKFLYKIVLIEGVAIKMRLANTNENRSYAGLKYHLKNGMDKFDAYFIKQITSELVSIKSDSFIKSWKPD